MHTDVRIYIAGSLRCVSEVRGLSHLLSESGFAIASTWHDVVEDGDADPTHPVDRSRTLSKNLSDLQRADVVVALVRDGAPRCTYVEIGYALALCKPVVWFTDDLGTGRCLGDAHALSSIVTSEGEIGDAVVRAARRAE
jgi:nucleoside 2-deoxyribosyltransferase